MISSTVLELLSSGTLTEYLGSRALLSSNQCMLTLCSGSSPDQFQMRLQSLLIELGLGEKNPFSPPPPPLPTPPPPPSPTLSSSQLRSKDSARVNEEEEIEEKEPLAKKRKLSSTEVKEEVSASAAKSKKATIESEILEKDGKEMREKEAQRKEKEKEGEAKKEKKENVRRESKERNDLKRTRSRSRSPFHRDRSRSPPPLRPRKRSLSPLPRGRKRSRSRSPAPGAISTSPSSISFPHSPPDRSDSPSRRYRLLISDIPVGWDDLDLWKLFEPYNPLLIHLNGIPADRGQYVRRGFGQISFFNEVPCVRFPSSSPSSLAHPFRAISSEPLPRWTARR